MKKVEQIADLMLDCEVGFPYDGAKEHYILDIENSLLTQEVIAILVYYTVA